MDKKAKSTNPVPRQEESNPNFMKNFAEEVAKRVIAGLPKFPPRTKKKKKPKQRKEVFGGIFLDTSAIIDGRIFDVISLGLFGTPIVVTEGVLLELKHIADAKEQIRKDRGRRGLEMLNKIKKTRGVKVIVLNNGDKNLQDKEVDEELVKTVKAYRAKLITCDYNLEKKAHVHGVRAVNMYALSTAVKIAAVPGDSLTITIAHKGKESHQGVGYLPDGTMVVVEHAEGDLGRELQVTVARVIQTASGKILFAKKTL